MKGRKRKRIIQKIMTPAQIALKQRYLDEIQELIEDTDKLDYNAGPGAFMSIHFATSMIKGKRACLEILKIRKVRRLWR